MADIFVSYASEDRELAEKLATALRRAGYSTWWDTKILGGRPFRKAISEEIGAASYFIVLWSTISEDSVFVADEVQDAADNGKPIIPVTFDGSKGPIGFRGYQVVDLTFWLNDNDQTGFYRLIRSIESAAPSGLHKIPQGESSRLIPKPESDAKHDTESNGITTDGQQSNSPDNQAPVTHERDSNRFRSLAKDIFGGDRTSQTLLFPRQYSMYLLTTGLLILIVLLFVTFHHQRSDIAPDEASVTNALDETNRETRRWLLQFGVYRTDAGARRRIATLEEMGLKGLHIARESEYPALVRKGSYVLYGPAKQSEIDEYLRQAEDANLSEEDYYIRDGYEKPGSR